MQNKVELLGFYGSDEIHAQSAWTSTNRDIESKRHRIPQLLEMLAKEGHHTVFEKSMLHFLVDSEIATHIQLLKHRIGVSINGESARYKELKEDKYYLPEDFKGINVDWSKNLNPHSEYSIDFSDSGDDWYSLLEWYTKLGNNLYHAALVDLTPVLGRKRAKESCRFFKSYNSQLTVDISFNWRSFHHFLSLRKDSHAQKEINDIAIQMLELVKNIEGNPFEHTIAAFGYNN